MIVASLLLILVAVALLALGLTSGSSGLLIASIVASLLAAIALVIGARRTAGNRRASAGRPAQAAADPSPAAPEAFEDAEADGPSPAFAAEFAAAQAAATAPPVADPGDYPTAEHPAATTGPLDLDLDDELPWRTTDQAFATQPIDESEVAAATGADYDRASSAINAARSEQPEANAWRRDTHAEAAAAQDLPDEFAEADADDPDDEPLPQAVQPADAVRVARMDAEVLVVDGRPRYHLADCAHLVGRLTEPIPVNEAVELGFSPCGLCRPVDRLVAAEARR